MHQGQLALLLARLLLTPRLLQAVPWQQARRALSNLRLRLHRVLGEMLQPLPLCLLQA